MSTTTNPNPLTLNALFWAKRPGREIFDVGPFPSREDAQDDAPELMKLSAGTGYEIGELVPYVPRLPNAVDLLVRDVAFQIPAAARPPALLEWVKKLPRDAKMSISARAHELNTALALVLNGWLHQHDLVPRFGVVKNITRHVVGDPKATHRAPEAESTGRGPAHPESVPDGSFGSSTTGTCDTCGATAVVRKSCDGQLCDACRIAEEIAQAEAREEPTHVIGLGAAVTVHPADQRPAGVAADSQGVGLDSIYCPICERNRAVCTCPKCPTCTAPMTPTKDGTGHECVNCPGF